ncbi:glycosyltransferase family 17 protein [Flexibacterium corallicola]|uniref:N-acetylglucosaminyltransferase n=1 Tax=Flexibacterium corallicola TaxID=3037259 RepID=UPI00286F092E|nr:N-acetylglucosaminyltransferase [Pseudovibrio sp. M1P-2-3]
MKVIDGFTFFNELDVLELRLGELYDYVDQFVLVEATKTFTGKDKPLYFEGNRKRFAQFEDKITHVIVDDFPEGKNNPWSREYHQRRAIKHGLPQLQGSDLIIVGDVDEIPKPQALKKAIESAKTRYCITFFGADIMRYRLNFKDDINDLTSCPRMISARYFQDAQDLREVRALKSRSAPKGIEWFMWHMNAIANYRNFLGRQIVNSGSWHFSYIGDMEKVLTKIAAYSHTEHMNETYLGRARRTLDRLDAGIGRGKLVPTDSNELPVYFRTNLSRFSHLYVEPRS